MKAGKDVPRLGVARAKKGAPLTGSWWRGNEKRGSVRDNVRWHYSENEPAL